MELYSFRSIVAGILTVFSENIPFVLVLSLIVGVILWIGMFILQAFGLYAMAKKRNMEKPWMAFIPFANILYMGKIAGECKLFGRKVSHVGVWAMIAQILSVIATLLLLGSELYLYLKLGMPESYDVVGTPYWGVLTGFDRAVSIVYDYGTYFLSIFQLITGILLFMLMMEICKTYAYKNHFILSFLSLFVPISRFIIVFALRNNEPYDYEDAMRKRRENYYNNQQSYYGGPYQNPYQNPYQGGHGRPYGGYGGPYQNPNQNPYQNPYGAPQQPQQPKEPDEPFEEFSSDKKSWQSGENRANDPDEFFR